MKNFHEFITVFTTDRIVRPFMLLALALIAASPASVSANAQEPDRAILDELRESIRAMIKDNPDEFYMPVFKETETELQYYLGGYAREGASNDKWNLGLASIPSDTLAVIELLRDGASKNESSKVYWSPILDQAEQLVFKELDLLQKINDPVDERSAEVRKIDDEARSLIDKALERVAASKGKTAQAMRNPYVRYTTETVTRYVVEMVPRKLPDGTVVNEEVKRPVAEMRTRVIGPQLYRVSFASLPQGAEIFYVNKFDYLAIKVTSQRTGRKYDVYDSWKNRPWSEVLGELSLRGTYYIRARWTRDGTEYRSGEVPVRSEMRLQLQPTSP